MIIYLAMAFKVLTTAAGCSGSIRFDIEHHEISYTTSLIICDVSFQTNVTYDGNVSEEDFDLNIWSFAVLTFTCWIYLYIIINFICIDPQSWNMINKRTHFKGNYIVI